MNILAIDTTSTDLLVIVSKNGQLFIDSYNDIKNSSRIILSVITELCSNANITPNDINLVAYINGPGSFTGLRLSSSIVQAMSFAKNIPVVAVSKMRVIAQNVYDYHKVSDILILLEALRKEMFCGEYQVLEGDDVVNMGTERLVKCDNSELISRDLKNTCVISDIWVSLNSLTLDSSNKLLYDYVPVVDPKSFMKVVNYERRKSNFLKPREALPNYIKAPHLYV